VEDTILLNEEVDEAPFALLCPVPMPHKVYGLSLADQTMDLQRIASVVWRQTLDNLYLSNNPRPIVPDGAANDETFDDMMDPSPGAFIRIKGADPTALGFQTVPFVAEKSFGMLEFIGSQVEARTGIRRGGNGLDRESLKKGGQITATQAAQLESKENERAEMVGRIFAETGVTRLFKGLLNLVSQHQPKARMVRLRNKWVEIDPRGWPEMDVRISVGLGVGNRMEHIAQADSVLETMAELQQTPYAYLIDAEKVHAAVKRKFQAAGIKNTDEYLVDPSESEPPTAPALTRGAKGSGGHAGQAGRASDEAAGPASRHGDAPAGRRAEAATGTGRGGGEAGAGARQGGTGSHARTAEVRVRGPACRAQDAVRGADGEGTG
jgi:hypothetical protein